MKPERTIVGIVTMPTASTLLTALPEIMPNSADPTTAIFTPGRFRDDSLAPASDQAACLAGS